MKNLKLFPLVLLAALAACTSTTATGPKGETLTLMKPADQSLKRGEVNKVSVIVRRDALPGDVALDVTNLPAGVEVIGEKPKIDAGANFGEFTLYARPDADLVSGHAVSVTARATDGIAATQWFHVDVKSN